MSALCVVSSEPALASVFVSLLRSPCTLAEPHLLIDTRYYSAQVRILTAASSDELKTLPPVEAVIVIPHVDPQELHELSLHLAGEELLCLVVSTKVRGGINIR